MRLERFGWLLCGGIIASALQVAASGWALQGRADPTAFRPSDPARKGQPVNLPRGDVLVVYFLQQLADTLGEPVYLGSETPPDASLRLERTVTQLDLRAAREILGGQGYELSEEVYRGKKVQWAQKALDATRKAGRILRPGEREEAEASPPPEGEVPGAPAPRGSGPALSVYVREGNLSPRYLLTLETDSRAELDRAVGLMKSLFRP